MIPTRIRTAVVIAAFALALSLVACGNDDDGGAGESDAPETQAATSSPFDRDACELLTEAEVEQALGGPVEGEFTEGDESTSTPGQCNWATGETGNLVDPSQAPSAITLLLGDPQIFDNSRILAEAGDDYEALDGVGDDAYAGNGVGGVRIGDAGITVTPIGVDVNNPQTHDLIVELVSQVAASY